MEKILAHFIALVLLFFGMWFLLSKIDFVKIIHVEELSKETEHKLGEMVIENIKDNEEELKSDTVRQTLDEIMHKLCRANGINDSTIKIHIIVKKDVNAFALPDRYMVVYTGLIRYCKSPDELAGVMAHEISHMEKNHVMKKLTKEIGLSMLVMVAGGQSGGQVVQHVVRLLSSTAFDREQEKEADASAVRMLAKANIDPRGFSDFLFRLSQEKNDIPKSFELLSTHPNSKDRAAEVLELRKSETFRPQPVIDDATWKEARNIISEKKELSEN
jgi:predicted Zn-dependent protease